MSIIKRYFFREILLPFVYTLAVVIFILLLGQLFKIVNLVVSDGVRVWDVMRLVLSMIPQMMTMALPISFFLAVLVGVGRMVGDGEVIAMNAAGISPYRLSVPVLQLSVVCTLITLLTSLFLAPWGIRQLRKATFDILREKVTLTLHPERLNLDFPGMVIYLNGINQKNGEFEKIFIEDHRKKDNQQTITAQRGKLVSHLQTSSLSLQLEDGTIHEYDQKRESYRLTDFSQYNINFALSDLLGEKLHVGFKDKARSNSELIRNIAQVKSRGGDTSGTEATLYERFTQPFSCIAFGLLGLVLVLVPVRSGARFKGFIFGLIILLAYYVMGMVVRFMAENQPSLAIFFFCLPNIVFILLGGVLLKIKQNGTVFGYQRKYRFSFLD